MMNFKLSVQLFELACSPVDPAAQGQATPSFFCRFELDVVYWNNSRSPGFDDTEGFLRHQRGFMET